METKNITIRINAEVARIFEAASEEQQRKLEALLSLRLSDATRSKRSLEQVMNNISQNAQARGLTPDILDVILPDD
jgi:hypothetical protein